MHVGLEKALEGMQVRLLVPDLWQQEAIRALTEGFDVIVAAPTGAGKTFIFESLIKGRKFPAPGRQAVYTVPTRALANEKWREWKKARWKVGIATGDLAEDLDAPILVATLETQRERILAGNGPHLLVIDEYQMIGDRQRGLNYELAVALAPAETRLLLLSGSVANPGKVADWLRRLGRQVRIVETPDRPVPLDEIPVEALPRTAPAKYRNFWHRLSLGVLLSHYGPLLIFAPHRKAAEKIAWKVAEMLPEDDPIRLGDRKLEQACSTDLTRLLKKRVAFHHSGLGFTERAAIIEPLAKAGQLRVIVATMGLAAGINFSVRSVFVAGTSYQDGPFELDVSPDELLQMFGRAGRRGLDETGFILVGNHSTRLSDARPLDLRRHKELDWPTMIRRMHLAGKQGSSPFEAARELRDRLFSEETVPLGFRTGEPGDSSPGESSLFNLRPIRKEILNPDGNWEAAKQGREEMATLGTALARIKDRYLPAECSSDLISSLLPEGARLCRIDEPGSGPRRYGLEVAVATRLENGLLTLTKPARKLAGSPDRLDTYTSEEAEALLPPLFSKPLSPAGIIGLRERGRTLFLIAHFQDLVIPVYRDDLGRALHQPPGRSTEIVSETHYIDSLSGDSFQPIPGSPARAWRKLNLIDDSGHPTSRGVIFSLFRSGEGLAVAAALEDSHYPIEDLVLHLANLRAGHRFELDTVPGAERLIHSIGSDRLASSCRQAYGVVDFEGYLQLGLPPNYGESAAEVISVLLEGKLKQLIGKQPALDFGPGDVERAYIEWLSLLRHLRQAPNLDDPRWTELKAAASEELSRHEGRTPLAMLPELSVTLLQKPPQHGIHHSML
jgi:hypothetical protein